MLDSAGAPEPQWGRREQAGLLLLTALALVLRFIGANSGLWIDEIFSLVDSFRLPVREIVSSYPGDTHHPLYAVLAHLSLVAFGESTLSIRLPSIIVGAASAPLLYLLGREVADRREAAFAALLLAVSYHHVWFSQNARGYVILAWCAMAGCWLLLRLLATGQPRFAAGFAVVTALGAYTHLTMVFIALGQALTVLAVLARTAPGPGRSRRFRLGSAAFLLAGAGTVALYAPALPQVLDYFLNRPSQLVGVSTPGWAVLESLRVLATGFGAGRVVLGGVVVMVGAGLVLAGAFSYARRNAVAFGLFVLPGLAIIAGALLARGTMYPRFFFALAGFGILIGIRGVVVVAEWIGRRLPPGFPAGRRLASLGLGLLVVLSLASLPLNYRYPKQDFVGALDFIEARRAPGEIIAVIGVTEFAFRKYLGQDAAVVTDDPGLAVLRQGHAVWFAWAFPRYLAGSAPDVLATLERECGEPATFRGTIGGGDVHVCRLEPIP
ncbi:MAG: glycosyltransferase family 39 protein [Gemmatimonadota bacterium]|nr:glycosyltransferase family 39 protein [Gemmatimonadota bacterium]